MTQIYPILALNVPKITIQGAVVQQRGWKYARKVSFLQKWKYLNFLRQKSTLEYLAFMTQIDPKLTQNVPIITIQGALVHHSGWK